MLKINENSNLNSIKNEHIGMTSEHKKLQTNLAEKTSEINNKLKPIIFKLENQLEIGSIEVKSLENDLYIEKDKANKIKAELRQSAIDKTEITKELTTERDRYLALLKEKND